MPIEPPCRPDDDTLSVQDDAVEREHTAAAMREGYIATRDDRRDLSRDWEVVDGEGWPD